MTLQEISNIRLINQRIVGTEFKTPKEIVSWMGAMQAQDYPMAKLAVGLRLLDITDQQIEAAYNKGEIIRTHLMRPTWHFVAADDIYWMLDLTAGKIKSSLTSRHIELELSPSVLAKSNDIIERALSKGGSLTRDELALKFRNANINVAGNRLSHLLLCAELDGLVCSGPITDKKLSFSLLHDRVPLKKLLTRDESLAELAKRYFKSHGPATFQDFVWWSGLSVTEARKALESVRLNFISDTIGSQTYWFPDSFSEVDNHKPSIHLLPAYDEFLISYKDRSATLSQTDNRKAVSDNGIFRPVIVINGQVSGLWKRTIQKEKAVVEVDFFHSGDMETKDRIGKVAKSMEPLFGKTTTLILLIK